MHIPDVLYYQVIDKCYIYLLELTRAPPRPSPIWLIMLCIMFLSVLTNYIWFNVSEQDKKIQCPYCDKGFVHKFRLQEHIRAFHPAYFNPSTTLEESLVEKNEAEQFNI